jgi:dUTP pyrophosphatase
MIEENDKEFDNLSNEFEEILRSLNDSNGLDIDKISKSLGLDFDLLNKKLEEQTYKIELSYVKIHSDASDPVYAYETDSCFDLCGIGDHIIEGFGRILVPTGLKFDIPKGMELQVRSKSGLAINYGLIVLNSPGTVDYGYDGEIKVILHNTTPNPIMVNHKQKICQCCLSLISSGSFVNLIEKQNITSKERGENGFGSTGI